MKKKSVLVLAIVMLLVGGGVGYASSMIFDNLNTIKVNFDSVFGIAKRQKDDIKQLTDKLSSAQTGKDELEHEIGRLKADIESIKTNHTTEISNKQAEIAAKQEEIGRKQEEVNQKQNTINDLTSQLSNSNSQLSQAEAKVVELMNYTSDKVNELTQ